MGQRISKFHSVVQAAHYCTDRLFIRGNCQVLTSIGLSFSAVLPTLYICVLHIYLHVQFTLLIFFFFLFLTCFLFTVRSSKSQQNIMTPCHNTLPGPEYYGTSCLMTASAHLPESSGSTS